MSMQIEKSDNQIENVLTDESKDNEALYKLAELATQGDQKALDELCEKIAAEVLFSATYIIGNRTDAEDVSQEVLLYVYEKITDLQKPSSFKAWLSSIVNSEANMHFRKKQKHGRLENIDDYMETIMEYKNDMLPQEYSENKEIRGIVMEIIETLPVQQRKAIILHYYNELSITETADVMGISTSNVAQYLMIAREKIKHGLESKSFDYREKLAAVATLPMGGMLSNLLQQESIIFASLSAEWVRAAMAKCSESVAGGAVADVAVKTATTVVAAGAATGAVAATSGLTMKIASIGAAACVLVAAAVVSLTMVFNQPEYYVPMTGNDIVFSGGMELGENHIHINPDYVWPEADRDFHIIEWWMSSAGSEEVLYRGENEAGIRDALRSLRESGAGGEHFIFFRIENEEGAIYKVGSNFYILAGEFD